MTVVKRRKQKRKAVFSKAMEQCSESSKRLGGRLGRLGPRA